MDMGIKGHYSSRYIDVTLLLLSKRSAFFRVAVIETDCEVDFAPPLDYKKPEKAIAPIPAIKALERAKVNPFLGTGRRLDGKPTPPVSSSGPKDKRLVPLPNGNSLSSPASSSPSNARPSQGKLVFGSNVYRTKETGKEQPESKQEPPHQKQPKFQPFIGKKYSLRGSQI